MPDTTITYAKDLVLTITFFRLTVKVSFYQEHIIISIFQFLINHGKIPNSKGLEQNSVQNPCIYSIYSL